MAEGEEYNNESYFVMTLRSNSGCNTEVKSWGWDESWERKRMIQLVKHREYRRVSTIYIPMYHEVVMRSTYITNDHLLDLWLMSWYSKVLKEQSLDSDKRCC